MSPSTRDKLRDILRELLTRLDSIAQQHQELFESVVREKMAKTIFKTYLKPDPSFDWPNDFGMLSKEGNAKVSEALHEYVNAATQVQERAALDFHGRLAAFQDENVEVGEFHMSYSCFFGEFIAERFDEYGNVIPET
jgi:hypothetical protein